MKHFALLMVLFTISFNLLAQSSPTEAQVPQDPKAKAILDALTKKNKALTTITADFTYKQENKDANINESQKGTYGSFVDKEEKVKIREALEKYCELDTLAEVEIVQKLGEVSGK